MAAALLFFRILSNYMNILHESVQNLLNDLLLHDISRPYTKRPRDCQSASWRQKPNIYKSGESPNVTVFINRLHTIIRLTETLVWGNWNTDMRVFMKRANQNTYCGIKGYLTPCEREGSMCRLQEP